MKLIYHEDRKTTKGSQFFFVVFPSSW